MLENIVYPLISFVIIGFLVLISKIIISKKFGELHGSQKLFGIILIVIIFAEVAFLGFNFGLFGFALEIITSIGVGIVILGIALQHQLKNIVAGIGLFFNKEINVGDIITIKEDKGTIIELHLTHTIALTNDGDRIIIPNQKFAEDVVKIMPKKRTN